MGQKWQANLAFGQVTRGDLAIKNRWTEVNTISDLAFDFVTLRDRSH